MFRSDRYQPGYFQRGMAARGFQATSRCAHRDRGLQDSAARSQEERLHLLRPALPSALEDLLFYGLHARSFGEEHQRKLADLFRALDKKGCLLMLSNSDTPLIRELYKDFDIREVSARRNINSKADWRGSICELVVLNEKLAQASSRERT